MKKKTKQEALSCIEGLDLTQITRKLMQKHGWTPEQTATVEKWYKRFLALHVLYPGQHHVPNEYIDALWHAHILDTKKYATDCATMFGEFMHHYPSYSRSSPTTDFFEETNMYYRIEFGEDCVDMFKEQSTKKQLVLSASRAAECEDSDGGQSDQS